MIKHGLAIFLVLAHLAGAAYLAFDGEGRRRLNSRGTPYGTVAFVATDGGMGDGGDASAPDAASDGGLADTGTISIGSRASMYAVYGQSNSIGSTGTSPAVSITNGSPSGPPYYNTRYLNGTGLQQNMAPSGATSGTEFYNFGAGDTMSALAGGSFRRTLWNSGGVGATRIDQLESGTPNWTAFLAGLSSAWTAGNTFYGTTMRPGRVWTFYQGGNDQLSGTAAATYKTKLTNLHTDFCTVWMGAPYSAASCPRLGLITDANQTCAGCPGTGNTFCEFSDPVLVDYEMARDSPTTHFIAAVGYSCPFTASCDQHHTGDGKRCIGHQVADATNCSDMLGVSTYAGLMPVAGSITCAGTTLTIPLQGATQCGVGTGLTIDTTNVLNHPHSGVLYSDTSADPAVIVGNCTISGENVVCTLDRNCAGTPTVEYALTGQANCNSGSTSNCGTGGNVRRTTGVAAVNSNGSAVTSYRWLSPFREAVTITSGSPQTWTWENVGSAGGGTTSSDRWGTHSSTIADAVSRLSIVGFGRTQTGAFSSSVNYFVEAFAGCRKISTRTTGTSGGVVVTLYTGCATAAVYTATYAAATLVAATNYQYAIVYDGTNATPALRELSLYRDGVLLTPSSTSGTIPATLTAGGKTRWEVLTGSPGTTPRVAHVSVWNERALTITQINQLHDAADAQTPVDPRPVLGFCPSLYWPFQRSGADFGCAASTPMDPYGAGALTGTVLN